MHDQRNVLRQEPMSIQRERLNILYDRFFFETKTIFVAKNKDYNEDQDPLSGFRTWGVTGILVRLGDKFGRLNNIWKRKGFQAVIDESIKDTLQDICNYCFLAYAVIVDDEHRFIKDANQDQDNYLFNRFMGKEPSEAAEWKPMGKPVFSSVPTLSYSKTESNITTEKPSPWPDTTPPDELQSSTMGETLTPIPDKPRSYYEILQEVRRVHSRGGASPTYSPEETARDIYQRQFKE